MNHMRPSRTFLFEKYPFTKNAQRIAFIKHGALLRKNFSQKGPQVRSDNKNYLVCVILSLKN